MATNKWWWAVITWLTLIWILSDQADLSTDLPVDFIMRKIAHAVEFGVLVLLIIKAQGLPTNNKRLIVAVLLAIGYAFLDEWHQSQIVGRSGNVRDVIIDSFGVVVAVSAVLFSRDSKN